MMWMSNQKTCNESEPGSSEMVGYYFRTTFPVTENGTKYEFRLPTDFGLGGVSFFDGELMKYEGGSIYELNGKTSPLDFDVTLDEGNHVLEVYGSEKCCDGEFSWSFAVNDSFWMEYNVTSFNLPL
jgi:hypothetical protein